MADVELGIQGLTNATPIGSGGNAVVYRAYEVDQDRWVAAKVLRGLGDDAERRRFDRERRTMGRLSQHPGIITIYYSGISERGEPYLVLPLMEDGSLQDRIDSGGPMPWAEAVALVTTVARTVHDAHLEDVVHRDLKPANIMLSAAGQPLVTDFGIAKRTGASASLPSSAITLTPAFSPPETIDGAAPTKSADVYGLAATLYALVAGNPPFVTDEDHTIFGLMMRVAQIPIADVRPAGFPDSVWAVVEQAMAKTPEQRPASAAAFADLLDAAVTPNDTPLPVPATAPTVVVPRDPAVGPPAKKSTTLPWLVGIAALAAVVVVIVGLVLATRGGEDDVADDLADAPQVEAEPAPEEPAPEQTATDESARVAEEPPETDPAAAAGLLRPLQIAYFEQWPTPNQIGQLDGSFGDAVGVPVDWIPFASGGEMADAMESGEIDIAYSQGMTPFANSINLGADLKLVGIAVNYGRADLCVVQRSLGVTRANAAEALAGATVMTPMGNASHFRMLSMMEFLGVNPDDLAIVPAGTGARTVEAFEAGQIDVGCAFGSSVGAMLGSRGELLMTNEELESELGLYVYDVVAIPTTFGEEHGQVVVDFLRATQFFNNRWASDPVRYNPIIAEAAGLEDVGNFLSPPVWFEFPDLQEQLSAEWLGGNVQSTLRAQLETFERLGLIASVDPNLEDAIDTSFLEAALE